MLKIVKFSDFSSELIFYKKSSLLKNQVFFTEDLLFPEIKSILNTKLYHRTTPTLEIQHRLLNHKNIDNYCSIYGPFGAGKTSFLLHLPFFFTDEKISDFSYFYFENLSIFEKFFQNFENFPEKKFIFSIDKISEKNKNSVKNLIFSEKNSKNLFFILSSDFSPFKNLIAFPLINREIDALIAEYFPFKNTKSLKQALTLINARPLLIRKFLSEISKFENLENLLENFSVDFFAELIVEKIKIPEKKIFSKIYFEENIESISNEILAPFFSAPRDLDESSQDNLPLFSYKFTPFYTTLDFLSKNYLTILIDLRKRDRQRVVVDLTAQILSERMKKNNCEFWEIFGPNFSPNFERNSFFSSFWFSLENPENFNFQRKEKFIFEKIPENISRLKNPIKFQSNFDDSCEHSLLAPNFTESIHSNDFLSRANGPDLILISKNERFKKKSYPEIFGILPILRKRVNFLHNSPQKYFFVVISTQKFNFQSLANQYVTNVAASLWLDDGESSPSFHLDRLTCIYTKSWLEIAKGLNNLGKNSEEIISKMQKELEKMFSIATKQLKERHFGIDSVISEGMKHYLLNWKDYFEVVTGECIYARYPQIFIENQFE